MGSFFERCNMEKKIQEKREREKNSVNARVFFPEDLEMI